MARKLKTLTKDNELVKFKLKDGREVEGWMSKRFMGGTPTYWTMEGDVPRCVEPKCWSPLQ